MLLGRLTLWSQALLGRHTKCISLDHFVSDVTRLCISLRTRTTCVLNLSGCQFSQNDFHRLIISKILDFTPYRVRFKLEGHFRNWTLSTVIANMLFVRFLNPTFIGSHCEVYKMVVIALRRLHWLTLTVAVYASNTSQLYLEWQLIHFYCVSEGTRDLLNFFCVWVNRWWYPM